jgi:protein-L-isoaspartate(D-aspartate) O-methyltransferase
MALGAVRHIGAEPVVDRRAMVPLVEFLLRAREIGIMDRRLLGAIEAVPRPLFLDGESRHGRLYAERPQPIACGQLTTPPLLIARLLVALEARESDRILEVGTGTGYLSAVLSGLLRHVYTIDRFRTLVETAQSRFATLEARNITTLFGNGMAGWSDKAPFDRIVVTAAADRVPPALAEQLIPGGVLIMPIGPADGIQTLTRFERVGTRLVPAPICPMRTVPLIAGRALRL